MKNKTFDFSGNLKIFLIISAVLMAVGIILTAVLGPVLDISFGGGTRITYSYTGEIDTDTVASLAADTLGKKVTVDVTSGVTDNSQKLTISLADKEALGTELIDELDDVLTADEQFAANELAQEEVNSVSPTVGSVFFAKCLVAVIIAAILVMLYIAFRFRKIGGWLAGAAALLALLHDVLIAFFVTIVFRLDIDSNFVAVVMTLLGYYLNSTIVGFARIRENRRVFGGKKPLEEILNISNNQVLSRNIMTSVSTFLAIFVVLIVCELNGITSLRSLTIPLCFGIISGSYSSICLAPAIWVKWKNASKAKKAKK